jgi:death-on-curing protein
VVAHRRAERPQTTLLDQDAYPDLWAKAAALLHSIVKNHPLVDGNKRLGWLSTAVFLELNGVDVTRIGNDVVYDVVIGVTVGPDDIEGIAAALQSLVEG